MAAKKDNTGTTVSVACKLPNGLVMRLFEMVKRTELVMGGGSRDFEIAQQNTGAGEYTLKGAAIDLLRPAPLFSGYAITEGIPGEFWDEWLKQNAGSDVVKNRLVFAHQDLRDTLAEAKANVGTKSGTEPMNPDGDPRSPKRLDNGKPAVEAMNTKEDA